MRKIVQIAAVPETQAGYAAVYALSDDGCVWLWLDKPNENDCWGRLPDIPQDQPQAKDAG